LVKFWEESLKWNIKELKIRVAHMEKHGIGNTAIKEKAMLSKVEKQLKDWKIDNN